MNKYVFPGADASTPLGWFIDSLEGAGFEVKHVDTIGGTFESSHRTCSIADRFSYSSLQRYSLAVVQKLDGQQGEGQ
jgi:hypothetical protein